VVKDNESGEPTIYGVGEGFKKNVGEDVNQVWRQVGTEGKVYSGEELVVDPTENPFEVLQEDGDYRKRAEEEQKYIDKRPS
jgi:hypothetical protein